MGERGRHWTVGTLQVSVIGFVVSGSEDRMTFTSDVTRKQYVLPTFGPWPNGAVESERGVLECT